MSERTSSTIRGRDTEPAKDASEVRGQIDAFYDRAETYVTGLGRIVGVDTSAAPSGPIVPPASVTPASRQLAAPAARRFEIEEITKYRVTNGRESLLLDTREQADAVLAKLREAGQ